MVFRKEPLMKTRKLSYL